MQQGICPGNYCCFYEFHSRYQSPLNTSEALRVALAVPSCVAEEALPQIQPVLDSEVCPELSKAMCGYFLCQGGVYLNT